MHGISERSKTPLLLVTGLPYSGMASVSEELQKTLGHLTHIIRSVGQVPEDKLQEARESGKQLAVAFVPAKDLSKIKKSYESTGAKAYTALLKATPTNNSRSEELIELNKKSEINPLKLDLAAEERVIKSRMREKSISERYITQEIKRSVEPEERLINQELSRQGIDFIIHNLGESKVDKVKTMPSVMRQFQKLPPLVVSRESLRKNDP